MKPTRLQRIFQSLRRNWDRWLMGFAVGALAATFLEPTMPVQRPLFEYVIVLDITQSMNVQDYALNGKPVSRLQYAKQALRRSLAELPCGSKIGWGIFTEYRSFLLFSPVEVCANYRELQATLANIDGRMAWTGNSEIAKGVFSGIKVIKALESRPALVFVTEGQEAPPLNPRHRPTFDGKRGEVGGLIVGVGGLAAQAIPKIDPLGRPLGYWEADEVLQVDPWSLGRGGSVGGEQMAETETGPVTLVPGAMPGAEHLSGLREGYLKLLSGELGLGYHRLQDVAGLTAALQDDRLARVAPARADLRYALAAFALAALLVIYLAPAWQRASASRKQSKRHARQSGNQPPRHLWRPTINRRRT